MMGYLYFFHIKVIDKVIYMIFNIDHLIYFMYYKFRVTDFFDWLPLAKGNLLKYFYSFLQNAAKA